ncbi:MAG: phosphoglycolate phosphatase [Promethearchaeota archaeon]
MIRGVVFDLDGTLLDFVTAFDEIMRRTFQPFGLTLTPDNEEEFQAMALSQITGKSSRFVIVKLIWSIAKKFGLGFRDRVRFLKTAGKNYRDVIRDVKPIPGAFDVLKALKEQGYKVAVVTTASTEEVQHRFEKFPEVLNLFDVVVGRDNVKHMKPAPEGVLLVAHRLGLDPSELVVVGDMHVDVLAGKRAGARAVGVLTGYGSESALKEAGADLILNSVAELPAEFPDW